jgi:cysteinyl-tRNA synthetase
MFSVLGLLQQLIGWEIIQRLWENHILKLLCEQIEGLTLQLMDKVEDMWRIYPVKILARNLLESDRPTEGTETESWALLLERVKDATWKAECMKREEKFDMQFKALNIIFLIWTHRICTSGNN